MAAKERKYSDDYLQLGFTSITIGGIQQLQCVICHKVLSADSMRPINLSFDSTGRFQQQNEATLAASYEISQMIAKTKKPHTIGETLIAPCVEVIVKRML